MMKRILTIFGTRPEAIKLAPIILEFEKHSNFFENFVCITAQHREMLDQVLDWFQIRPHYDLNLMRPDQCLAEFTSRALDAVSKVIQEVKPDMVIVQGDTTTAMTSCLASFYHRIPVGHVEAGLRTFDRYNPFPEEINRRIAGLLANFHFAPTERASAALLDEKVPEKSIFITGNTVIDSLLMTLQRPIKLKLDFEPDSHPIILVTAHRRESFGQPFESLCMALRNLAERNEECQIIYPVHLNPNVRIPVENILADQPRINLIEPLRYEQFCYLMSKAYLILTDSGGIQEEAPILAKPTLVMRETTERPEAIEIGTARLVGTNRDKIVAETERLLYNKKAYHSMANAGSPFGDGHAAERIVDILLAHL